MSANPLNAIKVVLTAIVAAVSTHFSAIGDLLWLFIAAVILDYITGMSAAFYNRELDSRLGIRGIVKKLGSFCIITVAIIADEVVTLSATQLGLELSTHGAIAAVVTVWLILNELISILENIARMNVALPPFLLSAIRRLERYTEATQEVLSDSGDEKTATHETDANHQANVNENTNHAAK